MTVPPDHAGGRLRLGVFWSGDLRVAGVSEGTFRVRPCPGVLLDGDPVRQGLRIFANTCEPSRHFHAGRTAGYGMRRRVRTVERPFHRPAMVFPSLDKTPVNRPSAW